MPSRKGYLFLRRAFGFESIREDFRLLRGCSKGGTEGAQAGFSEKNAGLFFLGFGGVRFTKDPTFFG